MKFHLALQLGWIAGLTSLLAWSIRAIGAARRRPHEPVARGTVAAAAAMTALLAFAAAQVWGAEVARAGMERIVAAGGNGGDATPARARLFLRHAQLVLRPGPGEAGVARARVGYSPEAGLRLPRGYGFEEARRGWDLLELSAAGPQGLRVDGVRPEGTSTRVILEAVPHLGAEPASPEQVARTAREVTGRGAARCAAPPSPSAASLDGPGAIYAVLCVGRLPRAALAIERDLLPRAAGGDVPVRVSPLVWAGNAYRPHHVQIASGELIQIGAMTDALPGVTLWEVPAPAGRAELFFPPASLLAPCSEWLQRPRGAQAGFFSQPPPDAGPAAASEAGDAPVCVLPFTPPFGLEVRRLLPDVGGVTARSLWAAGLLAIPALLLLLVLCAQPRGQLRRDRFARALTLAWMASFLAALGVWRLLWAHRIDMLRDYESVGIRVAGNQALLVLAGAALAATAVLTWGRRGVRGAALALGAWLVWGLVGGYAVGADLADLADLNGRRLWAQGVLSAAIGMAPAWLPWLRDRLVPALEERLGRIGRAVRLPGDAGAHLLALAALLGLAALVLLAATLWPRAVALKLGGAWAFVLLWYAALRTTVTPGGVAIGRFAGAGAAAAVTMGTLAGFDPGVTFAVAGPGFLVALVIAAHDARYADDSLRRLSSYRRHSAPLVLAHSVIIGALAIGVAIWALTGLVGSPGTEADAGLARSLTRGALHLLPIMALLLGCAAALSHVRRGVRAALPWALIAMVLFGGWLARGPVLDRVLGSSTQAASRIALVLDPGYALLRSDSKFMSGITAWRETIIPGAGAVPAEGQGYFGAQLIDPGVLLSIENDYLPVLLLRETGVGGIVLSTLLLLVVVTGLWLVAGARFRHGSGAQRARILAASVLGVLAVYQPLAALGALPLTGIALPGAGLDSPSDFWLLFALLSWILLWGGPGSGGDLEPLDAELRGSRLFRRTRRAVALAAALAALAGLLLVGRAAAFAARRPNPVDDQGRAAAPFTGLRDAVDYAQHLQCPWQQRLNADPRALVPDDILGAPHSDGAARFHAAFREDWRSARGRGIAELTAFAAREPGACGGRGTATSGRWRFERSPETPAECRMSFEAGWPAVRLEARRVGDELRVSCSVEAGSAVLRQLRFPLERPYEDARVRLVSRAMGAAARDRGELVSGHTIVRLRPGAESIDVSQASAGLWAAAEVRISEELTVRIGTGDGPPAILERRPPKDADQESWLLVHDPPPPSVQVLESDQGRWRLIPSEVHEVALERTALIVVSGPRARSLWLFRPPRTWTGEGAAAVDPLLADDVSTVQGERRRHYLYGGLLPELGWVNPYHARMSLGLDGWVRAALAEYEERPDPAPPSPPVWLEDGADKVYCPALAGSPPEAPEVRLARVCSPSPVDGVLECRVSLQPELEIQLQHLVELIGLDPERFIAKDAPHPVQGELVLMRGDSGELLARAGFVPGRASSAYGPATPELEQHLIRLREDRDPVTGRKLPRWSRGESSAEKFEWNQPIALGSTIKPLLAWSAERAAPGFIDTLVVRGSKIAAARCRGGTHAMLGHCPPTDSLWNQSGGPIGVHEFLVESINWYQGALGLLGTAAPGGEIGFGDAPVDPAVVLQRDLGDWPSATPLFTRYRGKTVIGADRTVDLEALRTTPMWSELERLLGRRLCTAGNKTRCRRRATRRDLCAARALPIGEPTRDLRHLVALGPDAFDFYPRLADPRRTVGPRIHTREYFQFLRGSGLHPLGSLAQLTDAFNRGVFDGDPYRTAASWFPVASTPIERPACGSAGLGTVRRALCDVIERGTAGALRGFAAERGVIYYGAKTGTIDSLADVAESPAACAAFNQAHTIPDRPAEPDSQPYWLRCGRRIGPEINDSLLVVSFAVPSREGLVPLTLGVRFQRGGVGFATGAARHVIDVVAGYFAEEATGNEPKASPAPQP